MVKGKVRVNLVASISDGDELTDRLTSYPAVAFVVDASAKVDGENAAPITPSQFEQFAEAVRTDAERASAGAISAETSAQSALASEQAADVHADNALAYSQNSEASSVSASVYALDAKTYSQNANDSAVSAENSAKEAEDWADKAEQSAKDLGYMEFYIDGNGHLIMERTDNVDNIDFTLENGHLIMEVL